MGKYHERERAYRANRSTDHGGQYPTGLRWDIATRLGVPGEVSEGDRFVLNRERWLRGGLGPGGRRVAGGSDP